MGLLVGQHDETLNYKDSQKYQKILKRKAVKQLTSLLKIFEHFFLIILGKEGLANFSFNECIYCPK